MQIESKTPAELMGSLNDLELKKAPSALYLIGDATLLSRGPRVSVVGSRTASPEGIRRARALAQALVRHDIVVVSGLAAGIDAAAHRAAIEVGGRTVAVLGTPVDEIFPPENADLYGVIVRDHLAVSQFPSGYKTQPKNFPMRNRTMALLTDATVIVEAGEGSGTLHQGWEALRLGRLLFIMESVANNKSLKWPGEMIGYGAQVLSRDNLENVLSDIPAVTSRIGGELEALY